VANPFSAETKNRVASSRDRANLLRAVLSAAAVLGATAVLLPGGLATSQPSRVQGTYVKDKGYFYRMTARFTVKETGEALDFDYVVACNIRLTRWRDGGLSNDSTFSPRVMVKATAGGQAVMLKTFYACNGITSDRGALPGPGATTIRTTATSTTRTSGDTSRPATATSEGRCRT